MKVLHIITGLNVGGAETMLTKLLASLRAGGPTGEVIALGPEGPMAAPIRALGVPVTSLGAHSGIAAILALPRLVGLIRRARPDIVHCWIYHANFLGGLAARVASRAPVLWGLRQSALDLALTKRSTIAVLKLCARLSYFVPHRILCVSDSARLAHVGLGYDPARMVVIPNGFDLQTFRPDASARASLRTEIGIGANDVLVGIPARFDPQKDIGTFLDACARVVIAEPGTHFLLCGEGMDAANAALARMIAATGLGGRVHLLGRRGDMPRVTAALDIAVSSSAFGEGFSNALGEALACGVPAVATDVGDARRIVGEAGRIVPARDPAALARAIGELVALGAEGRALLGRAGRAHMARDYGLDAIALRYKTLYDEVVTEPSRGRLIAAIAHVSPWWAKIVGKIVLSRLPISGATWQRVGLFSPGLMLDPDYALGVFDQHFQAAGCPGAGYVFAEIGPGDSLASAVIGRARGAAQGWLIDSGSYASHDMAFYRLLMTRLGERHYDVDPALYAAVDLDALLKGCAATYLENGLEGLRSVPDGCCDFVFSQATAEHILRAEFAAMMVEIHRVLKPGGITSHMVDFRDHLGGGLNNLRFSEKFWEIPWFARHSGFYTNRLRLSEVMAIAAAAGLSIEIAQTSRWDAPPLARRHLAPAFQRMSDDDLMTCEAFVVFRKRSGEPPARLRQAVFLDRDGTINWNEVRGGRPYAPTRLEDFRYLPGAAEAIARFKTEGYLVIAVTNQPDLTTGKIPPEVVKAMHARLSAELGIDDVFVCPHTEEEGCDCRKPRPGLLLQAAKKWNIDLARSIMVGDRWRDVDAGRAAGCGTVHIDHRYAGEPVPEATDLRVDSLAAAADFICAELARRAGRTAG